LQFRKVLITILKRLDTDNRGTFHKHSPGDGLHPINESGETLPDGSIQNGDMSDICIVANAQTLCSVYGLPPFWLLWTEAFPDDPMSAEDLAEIVDGAEPYLNEFDPLIPDTRKAILSDLCAIRCEKLADEIERQLVPFTQVEKILDEKKDTLD
jgi:hypothetical protein